MQEYEKQQEEIQKLETFVDKNITRASTSGMAKSRRKTLEKMERIDKPMIDARSANIQFGFERNTGNDVMHIRDLKLVMIHLSLNLLISKYSRGSYRSNRTKWRRKNDTYQNNCR